MFRGTHGTTEERRRAKYGCTAGADVRLCRKCCSADGDASGHEQRAGSRSSGRAAAALPAVAAAKHGSARLVALLKASPGGPHSSRERENCRECGVLVTGIAPARCAALPESKSADVVCAVGRAVARAWSSAKTLSTCPVPKARRAPVWGMVEWRPFSTALQIGAAIVALAGPWGACCTCRSALPSGLACL